MMTSRHGCALSMAALLCLFAASCKSPPLRAAAPPQRQHQAAAAQRSQPSPRWSLATWCWRRACVLDKAAQADLLAFAHDHQIDVVYLQLSESYTEAGALQALSQLVRAAHGQGVELQWVVGEPSWALPQEHARALRVLDLVDSINQQLSAQGLPALRSVAYDIEPYLLPAWREQRAAIEASYRELATKLHTAAKARGLGLWLTLPFWFEREPAQASLLDYADGIIVMAYRNQVAAIADVAAPLVERAGHKQRPVVLAVETKCVEPDYTSFCHASEAELTQALHTLRTRFAPLAHVRGFAVHELGAWQALSTH